jgi:hypothetical protein
MAILGKISQKMNPTHSRRPFFVILVVRGEKNYFYGFLAGFFKKTPLTQNGTFRFLVIAGTRKI